MTARTDKKVGYSPTGKLDDVTPDMAASGVEAAFRMLEGRWKMVIVFHLFAQSVLRFSELERAIPGVSQKMLIQQLRELERDDIVQRTIYPQVPPKVEYRLTDWGQAMCPALDSLLEWAAARPPAANQANAPQLCPADGRRNATPSGHDLSVPGCWKARDPLTEREYTASPLGGNGDRR
jgi:DNA-binding HxlR family transcriptional regulator